MYKIKFYGLGGQGVVTAGKILCYALCMYESKYAKTIPAYGHERRGAPVFSDLIIDDKQVLLNSFVYKPDILVVFAPQIEKMGIDIKKIACKDTILAINSEQPFIEHVSYFKDIYYVNATQIAKENTNKDIPNIGMLSALSKIGIIKPESLLSTLVDFFGEKENYNCIVREAYEKTKRY